MNDNTLIASMIIGGAALIGIAFLFPELKSRYQEAQAQASIPATPAAPATMTPPRTPQPVQSSKSLRRGVPVYALSAYRCQICVRNQAGLPFNCDHPGESWWMTD